MKSALIYKNGNEKVKITNAKGESLFRTPTSSTSKMAAIHSELPKRQDIGPSGLTGNKIKQLIGLKTKREYEEMKGSNAMTSGLDCNFSILH